MILVQQNLVSDVPRNLPAISADEKAVGGIHPDAFHLREDATSVVE